MERVRAAVVEQPDRLVLDEPRQSSVAYSKPYRRAASSTASVFRPAMPTSLGSSGGGHVMYAIFLNAFEWALPMNA